MFNGSLNAPDANTILLCPIENNSNDISKNAFNLSIMTNSANFKVVPVQNSPMGMESFQAYDDSNILKANARTLAGISNLTRWTIEAWIYAKSLPFGDNIFYASSNTGGLFRLDISNLGAVNVQTNGIFLTSANGGVVVGRWIHVAATWDGVNLRIWVNGIQKAISTTNSDFQTCASMQLGADVSIASLYWNGFIKNFQISNVAKTVFSMYN